MPTQRSEDHFQESFAPSTMGSGHQIQHLYPKLRNASRSGHRSVDRGNSSNGGSSPQVRQISTTSCTQQPSLTLIQIPSATGLPRVKRATFHPDINAVLGCPLLAIYGKGRKVLKSFLKEKKNPKIKLRDKENSFETQQKLFSLVWLSE